MDDVEFDQFEGKPWHSRGRSGFMQAKRGDMKPIILGVLREQSMHGYEIIRYLEERSHGMWRPSPGSVYPTLQLLEEEDLVIAKEEKGKKIYTLTDKGMKQAESSFGAGPWVHHDHKDLERLIPLRKAAIKLMETKRNVLKQALHNKDYEAVEQVIEIIRQAQEQIEKVNIKGVK